MPKISAIIEYWHPILLRMGLEIDYELINNPQCFVCGSMQMLERAHIKPRFNGGTDEIKNLHVLCAVCHKESEFFMGKKYWKWYMYKRPTAVADRINLLIAVMS